MKQLTVMLFLLVMLFSVTPTFSQGSEGGDSVSPAPSVTIGIEDALAGLLISAVSIGGYVLITKSRQFSKANPEMTQIVFRIGDVIVTIIPGKGDNQVWEWFKRQVEQGKEITFDELRDDLNRANR